MYNLSVDEISMVDGGGELGEALRYLSGHAPDFINAQANRNYAEYNAARAARNGYPTGSRSDMNSPGDQRSGDLIGGR